MTTNVSGRIAREVDQLRHLALRMGGHAEAILDKSLRAAWTRNGALCDEVITDDLEIDRLDVEIDHSVLSVLALRAPVARDLREVLAIKKIATDLERIGDLARNIAELRASTREAIRLLAATRRCAISRTTGTSVFERNALSAYSSTDSHARPRRVIADDDRVDGRGRGDRRAPQAS